jgi:hypothetical protein
MLLDTYFSRHINLDDPSSIGDTISQLITDINNKDNDVIEMIIDEMITHFNESNLFNDITQNESNLLNDITQVEISEAIKRFGEDEWEPTKLEDAVNRQDEYCNKPKNIKKFVINYLNSYVKKQKQPLAQPHAMALSSIDENEGFDDYQDGAVQAILQQGVRALESDSDLEVSSDHETPLIQVIQLTQRYAQSSEATTSQPTLRRSTTIRQQTSSQPTINNRQQVNTEDSDSDSESENDELFMPQVLARLNRIGQHIDAQLRQQPGIAYGVQVVQPNVDLTEEQILQKKVYDFYRLYIARGVIPAGINENDLQIAACIALKEKINTLNRPNEKFEQFSCRLGLLRLTFMRGFYNANLLQPSELQNHLQEIINYSGKDKRIKLFKAHAYILQCDFALRFQRGNTAALIQAWKQMDEYPNKDHYTGTSYINLLRLLLEIGPHPAIRHFDKKITEYFQKIEQKKLWKNPHEVSNATEKTEEEICKSIAKAAYLNDKQLDLIHQLFGLRRDGDEHELQRQQRRNVFAQHNRNPGGNRQDPHHAGGMWVLRRQPEQEREVDRHQRLDEPRQVVRQRVGERVQRLGNNERGTRSPIHPAEVTQRMLDNLNAYRVREANRENRLQNQAELPQRRVAAPVNAVPAEAVRNDDNARVVSVARQEQQANNLAHNEETILQPELSATDREHTSSETEAHPVDAENNELDISNVYSPNANYSNEQSENDIRESVEDIAFDNADDDNEGWNRVEDTETNILPEETRIQGSEITEALNQRSSTIASSSSSLTSEQARNNHNIRLARQFQFKSKDDLLSDVKNRKIDIPTFLKKVKEKYKDSRRERSQFLQFALARFSYTEYSLKNEELFELIDNEEFFYICEEDNTIKISLWLNNHGGSLFHSIATSKWSENQKVALFKKLIERLKKEANKFSDPVEIVKKVLENTDNNKRLISHLLLVHDNKINIKDFLDLLILSTDEDGKFIENNDETSLQARQDYSLYMQAISLKSMGERSMIAESPLGMAIANGHLAATKVMLDEYWIACGQDEEIYFQLLLANLPAFYVACAKKMTDVALVVLDAWCGGRLRHDKSRELFTSQDANYKSTLLLTAIQAGDAKLARASLNYLKQYCRDMNDLYQLLLIRDNVNNNAISQVFHSASFGKVDFDLANEVFETFKMACNGDSNLLYEALIQVGRENCSLLHSCIMWLKKRSDIKLDVFYSLIEILWEAIETSIDGDDKKLEELFKQETTAKMTLLALATYHWDEKLILFLLENLERLLKNNNQLFLDIINQQDSRGNNVVSRVIVPKSKTVFLWLCQRGADFLVENGRGYSALNSARNAGFVDKEVEAVIKQLQQANSNQVSKVVSTPTPSQHNLHSDSLDISQRQVGEKRKDHPTPPTGQTRPPLPVYVSIAAQDGYRERGSSSSSSSSNIRVPIDAGSSSTRHVDSRVRAPASQHFGSRNPVNDSRQVGMNSRQDHRGNESGTSSDRQGMRITPGRRQH